MTKHNPARAEQILECALGLFFQLGYEATSIPQICNAAGVTKGAFYHHFESKDQLLERLLQRLVLKFQIQIEKASSTAEFFDILCAEFDFQQEDANPVLGREIYRRESDTIRNRLYEQFQASASTKLSKIFQHEGRDEPEALAEVVVHISQGHQQALQRLRYAVSYEETEALVAHIRTLVRCQERAIESFLELPEGMIKIRSDYALDRLPLLGYTG